MIEFIENYTELLPYQKDDYIAFLDEDLKSKEKWYGISIQNVDAKNDLDDIFKGLEEIVKNLILKYDDGDNWILSHDDKDMNWFIKGKNILQDLKSLEKLFENYRYPLTFKGAISMPKNIILEKLLNDIVKYPYLLSYKNLDISNGRIPLIIKITDHLTIDIISTNHKLINEIESIKLQSKYKVIKYNSCN